MAFLYIVGDESNVLQSANSVVASPVGETFLPEANLSLYRPDKPFRFSAVDGTQSLITADLNQVTNGDFESWSSDDPVGWTVEEAGAADVTETQVAGEVNNGTSAAELVSDGVDTARVYQDFEALSGGTYTVKVALRGDGSASLRFRVQNLQTGRWLNSSLNWVDTQANTETRSATGYAVATNVFTVEAFSVTKAHKCTLRIQAVNEQNGSAFVDDVEFWPSWDLAAVLGWSEIPDVVPVKLQTSTDDFSSTNLDETMTKARPSFYHEMASRSDDRYVRLNIDGETLAKPVIGELFIGLKRDLSRGQRMAYSFEPRVPRVVQSKLFGDEREALSRDESLRYAFRFGHTTSEYEEFRDQIWRRSKFGADRVLVIPDDTRSEVHMGRFLSNAVERVDLGSSTSLWNFEAPFVEDPFSEPL